MGADLLHNNSTHREQYICHSILKALLASLADLATLASQHICFGSRQLANALLLFQEELDPVSLLLCVDETERVAA